MTTQSKLAKINLYDKFNAAFVSLITPEMAELNRVRKQNSYSSKPTFERPFDMPLEFISIDGVTIRMAKSVINKEKETIVLLSAFPHSIVAYSPIWEELKSNYNLYAYDLPGFGASETKPEYMSFEFQGTFLDAYFSFVPGFVWLSLKTLIFIFIFLWLRATLPRYRYDQIMRLGWKVFLPFSLVYVILTASFLLYFDKLPKGSF